MFCESFINNKISALRLKISIALLLALVACGTDNGKTKGKGHSNQIVPIEKAYENEMAKNLQLNRKNEGNTANYVRIESLKETVFEKGATYHFIKDSCAFYFECDCCSGLYVFPTDSTFYSISNCMNDEIVRQGTYRLADFELRLIFDQWVQRKMVKTALESDTTPDEVIIQRKKVEPMVKNYFTTKCGDLIKLTDSLDESLATEASLNYANIMKELAENKLIGQ